MAFGAVLAIATRYLFYVAKPSCRWRLVPC